MAAEPFRLPAGGEIDRQSPLAFTFNGRNLRGYAGDTLASALLANGIRFTGRSFKYHRPRGIQGAGWEEPGSLVQLLGAGGRPNLPITRVPLYEGLQARSVNCWPSLGFDLAALNQIAAPLLPAAFYYKTFFWPHWSLFEPVVRRAAGLGHVPASAASDSVSETRHDHCDLLIVGAGPAGLAAALTAGRAGVDVLLVDDDPRPGGRLLADGGTIDGRPAVDWVAGTVAELDSLPNVLRLQDATAWAYHEHDLVLVTERAPKPGFVGQRLRRVRARAVLLATGAIERPLVFSDNDRPGVMAAAAVRSYLRRWAVLPGRQAVVFANNDSAYQTALDLAAAGAGVVLADSRRTPSAEVTALVESRGIRHLPETVVAGVSGGRQVRQVTLRHRTSGATIVVACDLVCSSGGWNPAVHLFSQSRGRLRWDPTLATFLPLDSPQTVACAGAAAGIFDLAGCLRDGARGAADLLRGLGVRAQPLPETNAEGNDGLAVEALWETGGHGKAFVDVQNDVTADDLRLSVREGFGAVEHAKRYTTAGMGVDQGKTGNVNVIGLLSTIRGCQPGEVGTTTFRPPYVPIEFGAIAGHRPGPLLFPYRHTPMTDWHRRRGAVFYEAGARWRRPGYYPLAGEDIATATAREARAVREAAGVYDGSPLGKFEIAGPDAGRLLDFVYTNLFSTLPVGHGRYGLMLTDDGLILDDGVTFRLGEQRWLMTTSTAHADAVHRHLEQLLQVDRPDWLVTVTPVTSQWANATLCGPRAREVLASAGCDIDLANQAFPFMSLRRGTVAGLPARVCRVSFTGELSFEINVRAGDGLALWERLFQAAPDLVPVGSEANHVLRVEKGFLSLAHEVDGTADPFDLGLGWIFSRKKGDFIGRRAVEIRRERTGPRRELVGLLPEDPRELIPEGAPLTPGGRRERTEGFVSACVHSVVAGRSVGLGLLADGRARMGETVHARLKDRIVRATVVAPVFHDPEGLRLRN